jgi:MFS family permease
MAWSPHVALAYAACVPMGFGGAMFIASANILVQDGAPPTMRSRLLALTAVAFLGSTPIGGPITGWIGDHVDAEWSLAYGAVLSIAGAAAAVAVLVRRAARSARPEPAVLGPDRETVGLPDGT